MLLGSDHFLDCFHSASYCLGSDLQVGCVDAPEVFDSEALDVVVRVDHSARVWDLFLLYPRDCRIVAFPSHVDPGVVSTGRKGRERVCKLELRLERFGVDILGQIPQERPDLPDDDLGLSYRGCHDDHVEASSLQTMPQ
jgi:hypothetical protein